MSERSGRGGPAGVRRCFAWGGFCQYETVIAARREGGGGGGGGKEEVGEGEVVPVSGTSLLCDHGNAVESTGTVRRWSVLVVGAYRDAERVRLHQWRGLSDPDAGGRSGRGFGGGGPAVVDAEFRHGGDADPWGYLLDRVGERIGLALGSALTAGAAFAASSAHSPVAFGACLFLGGMAAASSNSAGGRLVSGWFPPEQRGLAMGIRQTAQPLGIGLGALVIPILAERQPSRRAWSSRRCCVPCRRCYARSRRSIRREELGTTPRKTTWPTRTADRGCCGASMPFPSC